MTIAQMPIWSMYFNRALALYAPGCISSKVLGGLLKLPTPAVAVVPALAKGRLPPTTHLWLPSASCSICGTRSRMRAGARLVHRSADSVTWVSASMMLYPLMVSLLQISVCFSFMRYRIGGGEPSVSHPDYRAFPAAH